MPTKETELDPIHLLRELMIHGQPADMAGREAWRNTALYFYGPDNPTNWYVCWSRKPGEWVSADTAMKAMIQTAKKYALQRNYGLDFLLDFGVLFSASPIFWKSECPPCSVTCRTTLVLVQAKLMTSSVAKEINKEAVGKPIV